MHGDGGATSAPPNSALPCLSQQKFKVNRRCCRCCTQKSNIIRKLSFPYARFVFLQHSHRHGYSQVLTLSSPLGRLLDINYRFKGTGDLAAPGVFVFHISVDSD